MKEKEGRKLGLKAQKGGVQYYMNCALGLHINVKFGDSYVNFCPLNHCFRTFYFCMKNKKWKKNRFKFYSQTCFNTTVSLLPWRIETLWPSVLFLMCRRLNNFAYFVHSSETPTHTHTSLWELLNLCNSTTHNCALCPPHICTPERRCCIFNESRLVCRGGIKEDKVKRNTQKRADLSST